MKMILNESDARPRHGAGVLSRVLQLITPQVAVGSGATVTSAGTTCDLVGGRGPGTLSCFRRGEKLRPHPPGPPHGSCLAVSLPKAAFTGSWWALCVRRV